MGHRAINANRLEQAMAAADLDGVVTTSAELASHLVGAYSPVHRLLPERPVVVVWPRGAEPTIVGARVEHAFLREVSGSDRVVGYAGEVELHRALTSAVEQARLASARIGVDYQSMPTGIYRTLRQAFPAARLVDAGATLGVALAVKPPAAISALAAAATATDAAEWSVLDGPAAGTEAELAARLRAALIGHGADDITFLTLGGSNRSATPQSPPTDRALVTGELVRFDLGGSFSGWMSDLARTVAVREPTAGQRAHYAVAWQTLRRHTDRLRPGARAADLYAAVAADLAAAGLDYPAPHVGHGIGYGVHEWPILGPDSAAELEPGMVLCSEVIFSAENHQTYHLEECVEVTEQAPRIISASRPLPEHLPVLL